MLEWFFFPVCVVPLVGTWIETTLVELGHERSYVVPLVGTWIETDCKAGQMIILKVVPLVGTWIETYSVSYDVV